MKQKDIARRLNIKQSQVSRHLTKHRQTGNVTDRPISGRPKATTPREDLRMCILARKNRFWSAEQVRQRLQRETGIRVSRELVNKQLLARGLKSRRPAKRTNLRPHYKTGRLNWAKARQHYKIREWRKALWSDESSFAFIMRTVVDALDVSPVKDIGTTALTLKLLVVEVVLCMVWGDFSYDHVLQLKVIDGTMNAVKYRDEILEPIMRLFLESPNGQGMSFQDDNARPHRARVIDDYKMHTTLEEFRGHL